MQDLPLLTAAAMREIEARAMKSGATSSGALMEVAGQSVVQAIWAKWPQFKTTPGRALVLCGPGNNGGDGYVIARLLHLAGWQVALFASGRAAPGASTDMAAHWIEHGPVAPLASLTRDPARLSEYGLIIDAIFGSGLTRPFEDHADLQIALAGIARQDAAGRPKVVAVDLPSGLCADSGRVLGAEDPRDVRDALHADLTVTFETPFLGHMLDQGPALCGEMVVAPLGDAVEQSRLAMAGQGWAAQARRPEGERLAKSADGHKFRHGHALVLAGDLGKGGAAQLAARAALRIGAGLVTIGPPQAALLEHALSPVAALMQRQIDGRADLSTALSDKRLTAICLGPGLGQDGRARDLLEYVVEDGRAAVIDADAVRLLAEMPDLRSAVHPRIVLTPHEGEFASLCPQISAQLHAPPMRGPSYSRVDAARDAARSLGCVLVLKGPATVIASPSGRVAVHGGAHRAAPDLATAGSGDVLSGMIAGLMARGWPGFRAARHAVWLHGALGRRLGPGLIADDLVDALPQLLREIISDPN